MRDLWILSILNISTPVVMSRVPWYFLQLGQFWLPGMAFWRHRTEKILTMLKIHCHKWISREEISLNAIVQLCTSIYYSVSEVGILLTTGDRCGQMWIIFYEFWKFKNWNRFSMKKWGCVPIFVNNGRCNRKWLLVNYCTLYSTYTNRGNVFFQVWRHQWKRKRLITREREKILTTFQISSGVPL